MKKYILIQNNGRENHAGSKARNDIEEIVINQNYIPVSIRNYKIDGLLSRIYQFAVVLVDWIRVLAKIDNYSCLLIQIPVTYGKMYVLLYLRIIKKIRNLNIIMIIHDLDSIRGKEKFVKREIDFLRLADQIICHNDKMKKFLINKTIKPQCLISLGIFDYIAKMPNKQIERRLTNSVIIAGNLSPEKSQYVYKLQQVKGDIVFNLYGPNYQNQKSFSNINYHGEFTPEEIIEKLEGSFGLVWDGDDIEKCSGIMGEYLKVNNPHKTSLYLAAGIPVIVWNQSAMAEFVIRENIGITVESLNNISEAIKNMNESEYQVILKNVSSISEKLRKGFYTKAALHKIFMNN